MSNCWLKRRSKPQPYVDLYITANSDDYKALGYKFPKGFQAIHAKVMADTGCQSCLVSMSMVRRMGLTEKELIPVKMQMHAANSNRIDILGAVILRLSGRSKSGGTHMTKQIVYVTTDADKFFLSREACIQLHMISDKFPTVGEVNEITKVDSLPIEKESMKVESAITSPCECPRRQMPPKKPTTVPFAPVAENRQKLEDWLLDYYSCSTFNVCEHQPLPMMEGPPIHLMIDANAKPVAHHTPIPVPLHWQEEVKAGLDQDIRLKVIEPVPIGEPVSWCHRMVICAKKNGKPRRTVDLQALNAHATRETHHTQSPFHQARAVPSNKKKSVFDCWNGYHSIPLYEGDRHLTTFITPWGRMRYRVAPQGYIASGDAYSRRLDEIVSDFPNKTKCIDDALLWEDTIEESFYQAVDWLDLLGRNGVIANPAKFIFGADEVEFAGFDITMDSVKPCRKLFEAIEDYPTPRSISDIRSWYGLINQVSYAFAVTDFLLPFRELLKPNRKFAWTEELNHIFEVSKKVIIEEIQEGVRIFDKGRPTCLATDWSKDGIGHWLLQKHCKCDSKKPFCCNSGWKTTLVGSRFTHAAESRYAPVEGEALAVADGLDKTRHFVLGCPDLTIAVDHKPLLKIFGDRSLNDIPNNRLRNLKEKTLRYKFDMIHVPGVKHKAADATSRHPTGKPNPEMMILPDDISSICEKHEEKQFPSSICAIKTSKPFLDEVALIQDGICRLQSLFQNACNSIENLEAVTWDKVKTATMSDTSLIELIKAIEDGFPNDKNELPERIKEYFRFREHLYTVDGVVLYKRRIVIPKSLRNDILSVLHSGHQAVTSMTSRAEDTVFWPGITEAIAVTRERCHDCNSNAPSQPNAPPTPTIQPVYPFQCICADFFKNEGSNYLVIVDRYSNWPIIERAKDGAKGLIDSLRRTFGTFGIPDELSSDGGPEFIASETKHFLRTWGVHHRKSSVAFPHSNCRAEVGVKTVKRLICSNTLPGGGLDTNALQRAILQYRNTPDPETKLSPAMCVFGRPIKDFIPVLPGRYEPHPTWKDTLAAREEALRNRHMRAAERWTEHTRVLPPLVIGDYVRIQNQTGRFPNKWDKTGRVIEVKQHDQYVVRVDGSGRSTLRNRKFLRKYEPVRPQAEKRLISDDMRELLQYRNGQGPIKDVKVVDPFKNLRERTASKGNLPNEGATPVSLPIIPNIEEEILPPTSPMPIDQSLHVPEQSEADESNPNVEIRGTPAKEDGKAKSGSYIEQDLRGSNSSTKTRQKGPPLALRRLLDFNKKGLKE